jgi:ABC-2 type transport system ATP-binding protein
VSETALEAVIQVENLTKDYAGKVRALKGANLTVARGERACLLGPNGAGKTTLIRILGGVLSPTSGQARILNTPTHEARFKDTKRSIGIVPEGPGVYDDLSVLEYLTLVQGIYGHGSVTDTVDAFELGKYAHTTMTKLSGGYQRRVVLAAAMLSDPEVLLLDEPTVRLDPVASAQVRRYIKQLDPHKTILLCTHNLTEAEELVDKVIIIKDGQILVQDSLHNLRSRFTRGLAIEAVEGPETIAACLRPAGYTVTLDHQIVRTQIADYQREVPKILRLLLDAGLQVYSAAVEEPSLEEIFLNTLGVNNEN